MVKWFRSVIEKPAARVFALERPSDLGPRKASPERIAGNFIAFRQLGQPLVEGYLRGRMVKHRAEAFSGHHCVVHDGGGVCCDLPVSSQFSYSRKDLEAVRLEPSASRTFWI